MLPVTVETTDLQTRTKKGGGSTYQVQEVFVHTHDRNGPKRYPQSLMVFPLKDKDGHAKPYPKGNYMIAPWCFQVGNGFGELGFIELIPAGGKTS